MSKYLDYLNAMWAEHCAPRTADAPTVVSTFAGCGGSSLGYSAAGYREMLAVEWEDHAAATFRRNFPHVTVHEGDIAAVGAHTLPDLAVGELDVFDGSPPCQGFSMSGLRDLADPRNQLFREFVRLVDLWQPKVFVMENVPGMARGDARAIFHEAMTALRGAGPGYRATARLVDASLLGVPQKRVRLVVVGVRSDLGIDAVHPQPQPGLPVTVRQAWAGLPTEPSVEDAPRLSDKHARLMAHTPPGGGADKALASNGKAGHYFSLRRLHFDRPSCTLTKQAMNDVIHPNGWRHLTSPEMSRLQAFPDQFDWGESSRHQVCARVGNSVPPPMMRAVAQTIRDRVLDPLRVSA